MGGLSLETFDELEVKPETVEIMENYMIVK